MTTLYEPRVLLDGLAYVESPRWREDRLWFAHWGREEIVAVGLDGTSEVVAPGRPGLGWTLAWLPDGRLLVTGETLLRREPDGTFVRHADLTGVTGMAGAYPGACDEIVVDGRGNVYVNSIEFDFLAGGEPSGGVIALVAPDGSVRRVAEGLAFPNGMVVTPDDRTLIVAESFAGRLTAFDIDDDGGLSNRHTWAENVGVDGITMDAGGGIWASSAPMANDAVRIVEGGEITHRITLDRSCFACMLGGPDRRTLFLLTARWTGTENVDEQLARRTGRIYAAGVELPGVGRP